MMKLNQEEAVKPKGIQVVNIGGKTIDFGHDMTNTFK